MSWSEVSSGHFQRELGENEKYIKMIGDAGHPLGHEHWSINVDATFETATPMEDFLTRLEQAWKVLRFQHPSIAAVASDTHVNYKVPDETTLQEWSKQTFIVEESKSLDEVLASESLSPYVVLHVFPKSKQILMHTSHWRADGVGVLLLFNAFFGLVGSEALPEITWGGEGKRLAPSVEDVLKLPAESTEAIVAESQKWAKTFEGIAGTVGIACPTSAQKSASGTRMVRLALSESDTASILQACKANGISATTAVHAAVAATNWALAQPDSKATHYTSSIRATLRTVLPNPFWPQYAAGLYTSGYMHSMPAGRSFAENAKELNDLYRKGVPKELIEATRQYAVDLQNVFRNTPKDASPTDVDISSVGIMDKLVQPSHGSVELTSVGVGVEMLTRQMMCFAWTFKGKLTLRLVYNEAYYPSDVPGKFLETLQDILKKELGIKA